MLLFCFLENSAANEYKDFMKDEIVVITNEGQVNWAAPKIISSYCSINVNTFPFDEQQCPMKFGPWQHEGKELRIWGGGSGNNQTHHHCYSFIPLRRVSISINSAIHHVNSCVGSYFFKSGLFLLSVYGLGP